LAELNSGKVVKATLKTSVTDYMEFMGTSMATPHVAGVVALIKAANPKLTPAQVKNILKQTAQPLGPNDQNQYGSGLVNAEAAVNAATQN
ncbi:MAG TPA: S8 family serine peptidase, partial [Bdellovibrio sp.]|nr:S8 family serine peptidase [Bdellovibrio sp.]